jgi:hypothetical protein
VCGTEPAQSSFGLISCILNLHGFIQSCKYTLTMMYSWLYIIVGDTHNKLLLQNWKTTMGGPQVLPHNQF